MEKRKPHISTAEMTEIILPQHTNAMGSVFGGVVMSWVDVAAAIAAVRHAQKPVVTASIDAMHFLAPIKLGWIVSIKASVNYVSNTSCEVGVRIDAEDPLSQESFHTASAYVTMVALNSHGRPTTMPPLKPETAEEKKRFQDAIERRKARLALKDKLQEKWEK